MTGEQNRRLRPKYMVFRIDEDTGAMIVEGAMPATDPENIDSPFVLKPRKDPAAFVAMIAYTMTCEPDLAQEIREFLHKIAEAPPVFGTQGERNYKAFRTKSISGDA